MTEEKDPIAEIVRQHDAIMHQLSENINRVVRENMRKEERIRELERLAYYYHADPDNSASEIAYLRRKLGL